MQINEVKTLFKNTLSNADLSSLYIAIQSGDLSSLHGNLHKLAEYLTKLSGEERANLQNEVYADNGIDEAMIESIKNGASSNNNETEAATQSFDLVIATVDGAKKLACIKKIKDITNLSLGEAKKLFETSLELQPKLAECKTPAEKNKFLQANKQTILLITGFKKTDLTEDKIKEYAADGLTVALA